MIKRFRTTEKSMKLIEAENTLILIVDMRDRKEGIRKEFEKKFGAKVQKIRTMIKDNSKYAYIKLNKKNPAIDIATKFGVI